jgi:phosphohistidine phosphatase
MQQFAQVVVLARHGQAVSTEENPERPLSVLGRRQAERMASWLADMNLSLDEVWHSGKPRAQQTASVLAKRVGVHPSRVMAVAGMGPRDEVTKAVTELEADGQSMMLVGHLPFLARLASQLLTGDTERLRLRFNTAGVAVLARAGNGWELVALADPDLE